MKIECESKFNVGDLVTVAANQTARYRCLVRQIEREWVGTVLEIMAYHCWGGTSVQYGVRLSTSNNIDGGLTRFFESELIPLPPVPGQEDPLNNL